MKKKNRLRIVPKKSVSQKRAAIGEIQCSGDWGNAPTSKMSSPVYGRIAHFGKTS